MKHKDKVKLAKRHMTSREIKLHVPMFETKFWEERKNAIAYRVKKKLIEIKRRKDVAKDKQANNT